MKTNKIDLGTKTIQAILNYIEEHQLKDGAKLPTEGQWMEILKCGRSTIRESMQVLAHSGAVVIKQGAGTFVQQQVSHPEQQRKLRSTVKMLEDEAIRELTSADVDDDQWMILKANLVRRNQLLEDGHFDDYIDADIKFHQLMVKMSGNEYLISWYRELQLPWKNYISNLVVENEQYRGNTELHNQLFQLLLERKAQGAIELNNQFGR